MKHVTMSRVISILAVSQSLWVAPAVADVSSWHVSIDVTGLSNLQLDFSLYDNSGLIGDSWALIDNLALDGTTLDNFEAGDIGAFDASLNPASVNPAAGSFNGNGSFVLRMDEDPVVWPTIAFRDIAAIGNTLEFDLLFDSSTTAGFYGLDQIVVSLLDSSLNPLVPGLNGYGDVFALDANGFSASAGVTVSPTVAVPAPGAIALAAVGLGCVGALRRLRLSFQQ